MYVAIIKNSDNKNQNNYDTNASVIQASPKWKYRYLCYFNSKGQKVRKTELRNMDISKIQHLI